MKSLAKHFLWAAVVALLILEATRVVLYYEWSVYGGDTAQPPPAFEVPHADWMDPPSLLHNV